MLVKIAEFMFIDFRPLNVPVLSRNMRVDPEEFRKTLSVIKSASAIKAETQKDGDNPDFDLEAEIKSYPNSLFVKCFAIKADEPNDNGDYFSRDELIRATSTFVGVPIFTNHNNTDAEAARGKVVHSWWDDGRNGIMIIARVDSEAYPQLARGIKEDYIVGTSMGCQVQYSLCSICHNLAETPDQYCGHIRERKTRNISAAKVECCYHERGNQQECPVCHCKKGESKIFSVKDANVFEYNYGIKFIENSFVVNPACHDCGVTEVIDPQKFLSKVADIRRQLPGLSKIASTLLNQSKYITASEVSPLNRFIGQQIAECTQRLRVDLIPLVQSAINTEVLCTDQKCVKIAGQKELQDLNSALDLLTNVSQAMLMQKDQLDLEFLSDLVQVLADLQTVTDELTQQGYGRLQSPTMTNETTQQNPGEQPQQGMTPVNATPGGGSKIQSGPAGEIGTVTSPTARKIIDLEKFSKDLIRNQKGNGLNIPFGVHKKQSDPVHNKRRLDLKLNIPTT